MIQELNGTPERQESPIAARLVLSMVTPTTLVARHMRSELAKGGYPVLAAEIAQRVAYQEALLSNTAPSMVDPDGPAARDIARLAQEVMAIEIGSHVAAA